MNLINEERIQLGQTDLRVFPLGIGAWAWGERFFWNYGQDYGIDDIRAAYLSCVEAGVNFFDTAEVYGHGRSEQYLGDFRQQVQTQIVTATKFFPHAWRLTGWQFQRALAKSLKRLQLPSVELYQMHIPFSLVSIEGWMQQMAKAFHAGKIKAIGVSNYTLAQTERAENALAKSGLRLASNQVEYHLLNRSIERTGMLDYCQRKKVTLIAYSPLAQGILTGKYTSDHPPKGVRALRYPARTLRKVQPLIEAMREIGHAHGGKSPAQVAVNWTICKGTLPIPGVKNQRQAQEILGSAGWRLSPQAVATLDRLSDEIQ